MIVVKRRSTVPTSDARMWFLERFVVVVVVVVAKM